MRHVLRILLILLAPTLVMAQAPAGTNAQSKGTTPTGTGVTAPSLTTEQRLTLVAAYQRALLSQGAAFQAQQKAQNDANAFYLSCASIVKDMGKESGTSCNVNVDSGEVTLVAPAKGSEKK